jgi:hypothetical protein
MFYIGRTWNIFAYLTYKQGTPSSDDTSSRVVYAEATVSKDNGLQKATPLKRRGHLQHGNVIRPISRINVVWMDLCLNNSVNGATSGKVVGAGAHLEAS